jgi:hypothetical protein
MVLSFLCNKRDEIGQRFFFFFFFFFLGPISISSGSTADFKAYCAFGQRLDMILSYLCKNMLFHGSHVTARTEVRYGF